MDKAEIKQRITAISAKLNRGQRLTAEETRELSSLSKMIADTGMFDDRSTVAAFKAGQERLAKQIKNAKEHGVNPGISSEAGRIIPPPPGYDIFAGKVCDGPGLVKARFGQPKICGRKATVALQVVHFEPDIPRSPSQGCGRSRMLRPYRVRAWPVTV